MATWHKGLLVGVGLAVCLGAGFGLGYYWAKRVGRSAQAVPALTRRPAFERRPDYAACLTLLAVKLQQPQFDDSIIPCNAFPCVVGIVQNNCRQEFESVDLSFILYDHAGVQIGTTHATVGPLEVGSKARFGAAVEGRAVHSFKLKKVEVTPAR